MRLYSKRSLRLCASVLFVAPLALGGLTGCIERTISITSEPPGAIVYVNDQEVGRTPVDIEFLHYGTYDVRVVKQGFDTYSGPAEANPPIYDLPVIDLFAAMAPVRFHKRINWHFELEPADVAIESLIDRARDFREQIGTAAPASDEAATTPDSSDKQGGSGSEKD